MASTSPRLSRYNRSESAEVDSKDAFGNSATRRSAGSGLLSDYTSKRLEELRLRRAESESSYADYKARREARIREIPEKPGTSGSSTSSGSEVKASVSGSALSNAVNAPLATEEEEEGDVLHTSASASSFNDIRTRRDQRDKDKLSFVAPTAVSPTTNTTANMTPVNGSAVESKGLPTVISPRIPALTKTTTASSVSITSKSLRSEVAPVIPTMDKSCSLFRDSFKTENKPKKKDEDECVGFATLPEQVHRKAVKRGFDFTLLVVGEAGLGKSTLINSLLLADLYKDRKVCTVEERLTKTVSIDKKSMEIEEKGVKLRLTIVDTPGYNDAVDCEQCWKPIEDYIDQQYDQFYKDETGLNRKNIKDNRVHCCLYFISPYGRGLKQVDVQFMKRLHEKVNIVPIIAKADTLTKSELKALKEKLLDQIDDHKIKIYEFPECDSDEDEEFKKQDTDLKASIPFAVIGSNTVVEVNGQKVRGRLYPWGIVEVDNSNHCDFHKLRQMLISTHMQDLKEVTRDIHYETFRAKKVTEQMRKQNRERNKLKRDSSPNFEAIMDADRLLQQKDEEIRKMQDMLVKMQQQLATQHQGSPGKTQVNGQVNGLGNL